jgi:hypothetical protein
MAGAILRCSDKLPEDFRYQIDHHRHGQKEEKSDNGIFKTLFDRPSFSFKEPSHVLTSDQLTFATGRLPLDA